MIRLQLPVHPEGWAIDLSCPVIACDTCGRPITAASRGIVLWDPTDDRVQLHVHKGVCDQRLAGAHGTGSLAWDDLDTWLRQLTHNYAEAVHGSEVTLNDGRKVLATDEVRYTAANWVLERDRVRDWVETINAVVRAAAATRRRAHGEWRDSEEAA